MKIKIDDFLTAEEIGGASKNSPVYAVIKDMTFVEANELPFESSKGKYELTLEIESEETKWLANKTSLRTLRSAFGNDGENWVGKKIGLWTTEQVVQGKVKKVIYADAV